MISGEEHGAAELPVSLKETHVPPENQSEQGWPAEEGSAPSEALACRMIVRSPPGDVELEQDINPQKFSSQAPSMWDKIRVDDGAPRQADRPTIEELDPGAPLASAMVVRNTNRAATSAPGAAGIRIVDAA
ncbi:hypothetical protein [Sorangium sp. So ce117]|uniref:hypothetical protein n=1 Tax=Sorangium sp. So ce117 TaxID=3133277 RepID=UPI003F646AA5